MPQCISCSHISTLVCITLSLDVLNFYSLTFSSEHVDDIDCILTHVHIDDVFSVFIQQNTPASTILIIYLIAKWYV